MLVPLRIIGKNVVFKFDVIRFFDFAGHRPPASDGEVHVNYVGDTIETYYPMIPVVLESAAAIIREHFGFARAAGKLGQVGIVLVEPRQALSLFFEGYITPTHLSDAHEFTFEGREYVDIPGVVIDDHRVTLRVRVPGETEADVLLLDAAGQLLLQP
jgi:hypothetical protein